MILVADSSALVALAACDSLVLLDEIFGRVIVPEAVYREVAQPDKFQSNRLKEYLQGKVRQVDMQGFVYPRWRPSAEACRFRCPRPMFGFARGGRGAITGSCIFRSPRESRPAPRRCSAMPILRITLSLSQVRRILRHRLKMRYSKPYPHDLRRPADAEEQLEERLIDAYNALMDRGLAESEIALGFLDEASPQPTANTARVWHVEKAVIHKNTAKLKANAIGFYAIVGHSVQGFLEHSTHDAIAEFLRDIRAAHPEFRAIVVVLDNFSTHRAASLKEVADGLDLSLVSLPPYSPDLNPIELIWKSIKRVISVNSIPSLGDLKRCITKSWGEMAIRHSFAKHWIEQFVPSIVTYRYS